MQLEGIYTAIITPFLQGKVDFPAFTALLKEQKAAGISGVIISGTTGEAPTLTFEEKQALIETAAPFRDETFQVVLGVGGNNTMGIVSEVNQVAQWAIDAILVVTPYYNKPTQSGLKAHFKTIAQSTKWPVILYNVPSRSLVTLSIETILHLSKIKNIVAIKEASGDLAFGARINATIPEFTMLSGDDSTFLPLLSVGASGSISVLSNIVPKKMVSLYRHFKAGNVTQAIILNREITELAQVCFIEVNPIPIKTALAELGKIAEEFRLPLTQMFEPNRRLLRMALRRLNLF